MTNMNQEYRKCVSEVENALDILSRVKEKTRTVQSMLSRSIKLIPDDMAVGEPCLTKCSNHCWPLFLSVSVMGTIGALMMAGFCFFIGLVICSDFQGTSGEYAEGYAAADGVKFFLAVAALFVGFGFVAFFLDLYRSNQNSSIIARNNEETAAASTSAFVVDEQTAATLETAKKHEMQRVMDEMRTSLKYNELLAWTDRRIMHLRRRLNKLYALDIQPDVSEADTAALASCDRLLQLADEALTSKKGMTVEKIQRELDKRYSLTFTASEYLFCADEWIGGLTPAPDSDGIGELMRELERMCEDAADRAEIMLSAAGMRESRSNAA